MGGVGASLGLPHYGFSSTLPHCPGCDRFVLGGIAIAHSRLRKSKLRAGFCGCFAPGATALVSYETLREYGKDFTVSQKEKTGMTNRVLISGKHHFRKDVKDDETNGINKCKGTGAIHPPACPALQSCLHECGQGYRSCKDHLCGRTKCPGSVRNDCWQRRYQKADRANSHQYSN